MAIPTAPVCARRHVETVFPIHQQLVHQQPVHEQLFHNQPNNEQGATA